MHSITTFYTLHKTPDIHPIPYPTTHTIELNKTTDNESNGIRFSISTTTTRQLPTIHQSRAPISLYDAQFPPTTTTKRPIPDETIDQVINHLIRFQLTCADFGVPEGNIHFLATEATRTAENSGAFRDKIREGTGWDVSLLEKEEEGRIGALGVVASLGFGGDSQGQVKGGLVLDLGGGSTQIIWVILEGNGGVRTSPRSFSFPYGAAALKGRLEQIRDNGKEKKELQVEMMWNFQQAYKNLGVPQQLAEQGLDLYLCGGGFRGWGYLLMEQASVNPYPIPIINGYRVRKEEFHDTASVLETVSEEVKVFGVSKRRASQVPAVAFLVNVLADALPDIQNIQFCQGGVREGLLFDKLPLEIRAEDPLLAATRPYATPSADVFQRLLSSALPTSSPASFTPQLLSALANLLYSHSSVPKESRCAAAMHSTTSGLLASANSLTHVDRALLALTLCERWDGDLAPTDQLLHHRLRRCVSAEEAWWCQYLGRVGMLIGDVYPAGRVSANGDRWRVQLKSHMDMVSKKKGCQSLLRLQVYWNQDAPAGLVQRDELSEHGENIEKAGKKKKWVEGHGVKVEVAIAPLSL